MPKGNSFDNDIEALILNGTSIAGIADNAASGALTVLYLSLHNADPTAAGNQTSHETAYTGYSRVAVARSSAGFTVSGGVANLTSNVSFGLCTAGTDTITHAALGTAATGAGKLLYCGPVTPNLSVANGVTPTLTNLSTVTET